MPSAQRQIPATLDHEEIEHFSVLAEEWWNPTGKLAALHRLNPLRLRFVRDRATAQFGREGRALTPFAGLSVADIGCGGGLLSEPLARMGFAVLGIDAAKESTEAAIAHAQESGIDVAYRCMTVEALAAEGKQFDVVLAMEVLEHVANPAAFLAGCGALVKPGGLFFVATINRTLKALALAKLGAEYVLGWVPRGTHDWRKFVTPRELRRALADADLTVEAMQGVVFDPLAWDWRLSTDLDVNYMAAARAVLRSGGP